MTNVNNQPPLRAVFVIPVYNHGDRIKAVVERALAVGWPVVVVDDGSTDSTERVLASIKGIRVLRHESNQGKGAALLTGFTAAAREGDWALTLDADGQHHPGDAQALLDAAPAGRRPLIVGCRTGMDGEQVPWTSRWGRRFSNFWVWLSCGQWVSDSQSGFRLYPLPEVLHLGARARRFQFEVEIIALAVWSGLPVIEAPVGVIYQGPEERVSHFKPGLDFWRNTRTFARLIVKRIFLPRKWRARKIK